MPITPAQFGQTFTEGVKYIKLNKLDKNGLDNSNKLQQADSIIINYPDIGPQEYTIVSTQPQQDYYLLGLVNNPNTSSLNEVLDYSFTAKNNGSINRAPSSFPGTPGNFYIATWTDLTGDSLGYFNNSPGEYLFGNTPNVPIQIQFSGSITTTGIGSFLFYVALKNTRQVIVSDPISNGGGLINFDLTLYLTSSIVGVNPGIGGNELIESGSSLVFNIWSTDQTFSISSENLSISFSGYVNPITPATSSLVVFTPEEDFYYSDYNPLFGNAEISQFSNHFMDVDYTSNFTTPVNFDLIISGTADRAQISDSNYSSFAWSNIRYRGSKYNSYKI